MDAPSRLPHSFLRRLRRLEEHYLREADPIRQSGFGGGPDRWRAEREPIVEAVDRDGDFLDVGCANGYLLECLVAWAGERGIRLTPYGIEQGARLVELAKRRLPPYAGNVCVANAWDWDPPRPFRYVYTLLEYVPGASDEPLPYRPSAYTRAYVRRLLERVVEPGGRLIVGNYGSRSRGVEPLDVSAVLGSFGLRVAGASQGGRPTVARFAWVDRGVP